MNDFELAVSRALDQPLQAEPLEKQLKPSSRVKIAFDDLCVPVPLMRNDVRGRVIKVLLKRLYALGIPKENIQLICANGLHRKWTLKELSQVIGKEVIQEMGPERFSCHDGTKEEELIFLGTTDSGHAVEINRAVAESDITIYNQFKLCFHEWWLEEYFSGLRQLAQYPAPPYTQAVEP